MIKASIGARAALESANSTIRRLRDERDKLQDALQEIGESYPVIAKLANQEFKGLKIDYRLYTNWPEQWRGTLMFSKENVEIYAKSMQALMVKMENYL